MTTPVIALEAVSFARGKRMIFEQLSFTLEKGEIVAVMGPSGTGKTTLMRLITGQVKPKKGKVWIFGQDVAQLSRAELMQLRRRISMLFQNNALFSDMTVGENVAFPLKEVLNLPDKLIDILVKIKLESVGLRGTAALMPAELSGGMARRAALARAMAMDPEIMIYDEPFTGQDPITLGMLTRLVRDFNHSLAMTSLIVTHDVAEVSRIADRILLLSGGKMVALDAPEAMYQSDNLLVEQFMHAKSDGPVPFHYPAPDYAQSLREMSL